MTIISPVVVNDQNIDSSGVVPLIPPSALKNEFPASEELEIRIASYQDTIRAILDGTDGRMLAVVGPCSIHEPGAAIDYARQLKQLALEVSSEIFVVQRAYFEKPRTTIGWKGMFQDPYLKMNGCSEVNVGARMVREVALAISELGMPIATEVLDPYLIQYVDDLISWSCIGARTVESQLHRELASGLSSPVGCKNSTNGNPKGAIDAVESANHPHGFWGMYSDGRVAWFPSKGNAYAHVVLRGGDKGPNCDQDSVSVAIAELKRRNLRTSLVVDCSHGNSRKNYKNQGDVLTQVMGQRCAGNKDIVGFMLESNIMAGRQDIVLGRELVYGQSVTDACIDIDETKKLLHYAAALLR